MKANKDTTTLILPLKDHSDFAIESLKYHINVCPCKIVVIYEEGVPENYIINEKVSYYKNEFGRCYSKIHNFAIKQTKTQYVLISAWRSRPTEEHFDKVFDKLSNGYAAVDLSLMHFTAFGKDLLRKIGWFDEGFVFGHCEDWDFYNRLIMSGLAVYITNEIPEIKRQTTWSSDDKIGPFNAENYKYYCSKWKKIGHTLYLLKKELNYNDRDYYKDVYNDEKYLDMSFSYITDIWPKSQHFDAIDKVIDETEFKFII